MQLQYLHFNSNYDLEYFTLINSPRARYVGQLTQALRTISHERARLIDKVRFLLTEHVIVFHGILIAGTIGTIICIYAQIKSLTLFSMHPLCMTIGTLIFIAEGVAAYRNRILVETFSPIMAHSLRAKNRSIHQMLHIIGGTFLGFGMLFIVANKIEYKKTILPHTLHALAGTVALGLVIAQIVVGHQKIDILERQNTKTRRWHGDLGLLTWDALCIALVLGLAEFLRWQGWHLLPLLFVALAWAAVHIQMRRKGADLEWLATVEKEPAAEGDIEQTVGGLGSATTGSDGDTQKGV